MGCHDGVQGTHTAIKSGILAAEAAFNALTSPEPVSPANLSAYEEDLKASWVWDELHDSRNIRPGFAKFGFYGGLAHAAVDTVLFRGGAPWTLRHRYNARGPALVDSQLPSCSTFSRMVLHCSRHDHESLQPAAASRRLDYPRPDGEVTFDIASSLYRSGTNHEHDQPPHLHLRNAGIPAVVNKPIYEGPESRYCPAGKHERYPPFAACAEAAMAARLRDVNYTVACLQACMSTRKMQTAGMRYRSMLRTACIARRAISKIRCRTSNGRCPRALAGRHTL